MKRIKVDLNAAAKFPSAAEYPHLDATRWSRLTGPWREAFDNTMHLSAESKAHLTSFMASHASATEWRFDASSLPFLEEGLLLHVKPKLIDVDASDLNDLRIIRVLSPGGIKTKNPAHIRYQEGVLLQYGMLFGQSIAQEHGYFWVDNPKGNSYPPLLQLEGTHLNPLAKPLKFCLYGAEDSLVAGATIYAPDILKMNTDLTRGILSQMTRDGLISDVGSTRVTAAYLPSGELHALRVKTGGDTLVVHVGKNPEEVKQRMHAADEAQPTPLH